jgi:hypothetical protein
VVILPRATKYTHIEREKIMLTLRLFDGLTKITRPTMSDKDLSTWARIEYKKDAEYAYFHMKQYGVAPRLGASV